MLNIIFIVVGIYAAFTGGLYVFQRNLLYYPSPDKPDRIESGVPDMKEVQIPTGDGLNLLAWYKESTAGLPTIVIYHGNAGNIGHRGGKARMFIDAGFGVLLVEYRGYGGNPGKPSESGLLTDGRAALDFLSRQKNKPNGIVLYGESLGSGIAVRLAGEPAYRQAIRAVVLIAPYTSITDVAAHHYPFFPAKAIVKDKFDSLSAIRNYDGALLVIHGEEDRTVPVSFGRKLFSAAREPKKAYWVAGAGHNDLFRPENYNFVINYLKRQFTTILPKISQ